MNIYLLGTLETTIDLLNSLKKRLPLRGVIGLTKRDATDSISGFTHMEDFCKENSLNFIPVETYALSGNIVRERLLSLKIDILIVYGWQRLIPEWLIKHCKICAIGVHGSAYGITRGRGRSPQNWALILGKKKFNVSIYKLDKGIDSGAIIDTKSFALTEHDDIRSSYYKVSLLIADMIIENIKNKKILSGKATPQKGKPRYLPQRLPEDGEIDWSRSTTEIYNFVRALTHPYPGAYSKFLDYKLFIWGCRPFVLPATISRFKSGEIAKIFHDGNLLIKTSDGFLLVDDYSIVTNDGKSHIRENLILSSYDFKKQIKRIIKRHYKKHPDLKISADITNIVG